MTNLIGIFIVAWDGNAFSVLSAEQPVGSPIVHKQSTEEQVYIPMDTAATIPRGRVTPPLDQDLNRVFVKTLLIICYFPAARQQNIVSAVEPDFSLL